MENKKKRKWVSVDTEKWPEAKNYENMAKDVNSFKTYPRKYEKTFSPFGNPKNGVYPVPTEFQELIKKHLPRLLDGVYTELQEIADKTFDKDDWTNHDFLCEWMEENLGDHLIEIMIETAILLGLESKEED